MFLSLIQIICASVDQYDAIIKICFFKKSLNVELKQLKQAVKF